MFLGPKGQPGRVIQVNGPAGPAGERGPAGGRLWIIFNLKTILIIFFENRLKQYWFVNFEQILLINFPGVGPKGSPGRDGQQGPQGVQASYKSFQTLLLLKQKILIPALKKDNISDSI